MALAACLVTIDARAVCGSDSRDMPAVFATTDAVFYGQVARLHAAEVEFRVLRSWKGVPERFAIAATEGSLISGAPLGPDKYYLVWAVRDRHGRLKVVRCGRTSLSDTEAFRADIKWLDNRVVGRTEQQEAQFKTYQSAQGALANRQYAEAARLFESVLQGPDFLNRRECQIDLGFAYRKLRRFRAAVGIYTTELNDSFGTTGSWDDRGARNRRAAAQWGLAISLLGCGEYSRALQAIEDSTNKYPAESWCGNAAWQDAYRNAFYRGLTLERLGRYSDAVRSYLDAALGEYGDPTAAIRLADLYESAGRLTDLARVSTRDAGYAGEIVRRVVELHEMESGQNYQALVMLLPLRKHSLGMPWEDFVARSEWEAAEAAALLARHPEATVGLLGKELENVGDHGFVYYALGLCGTRDATKILEAELTNPERAGYMMTFVHALTVAGAPGREALDRLSRDNTSVAQYRNYPFPKHWFLDDGIEFPAIPRDVELPRAETP